MKCLDGTVDGNTLVFMQGPGSAETGESECPDVVVGGDIVLAHIVQDRGLQPKMLQVGCPDGLVDGDLNTGSSY